LVCTHIIISVAKSVFVIDPVRHKCIIPFMISHGTKISRCKEELGSCNIVSSQQRRSPEKVKKLLNASATVTRGPYRAEPFLFNRPFPGKTPIIVPAAKLGPILEEPSNGSPLVSPQKILHAHPLKIADGEKSPRPF
jgi:hypothetical protein